MSPKNGRIPAAHAFCVLTSHVDASDINCDIYKSEMIVLRPRLSLYDWICFCGFLVMSADR